MPTIFTSPGKIGDTLLQWPVARQWSIEHNERIHLWLDAGTLKPIERLLAAQDEVECVEFKPGIQNYACGGQPWDFGLSTEHFVENAVYHLGFRGFPERQITLQTALSTGLHLDLESLATKPSLKVEPLNLGGRYVVVHGTFQSHVSGTPRFWSFFRSIHKDLEASFDRIYFTGSPDERERAAELYPDVEHYSGFDDHGDFYELAQLMAGAALVVGSGSSGVVVGGCLKVPTIRVHDPIGDAPKVIWSNLGPNQWNYTEAELRAEWPKIRERVIGLQPV